jgi:DNA-binding transcriptional ArsR family regulator
VSNSRALVTNSDIIILAHGKDYDKSVYVVFVAGKKDYNDVVREHQAFIDTCSKMSINLELEIVRVDELREKPFRSALSTLLKYYREYDEMHIYIAPSERTVSAALLLLAALSLPVDSKKIRLTVEDTEFRTELDVNNYVKFLALDETEKKIIWYLQIWGDAKLSEVSRALQASRSTIYNKLKKLQKLLLVRTTETYTYRAEKFINVYTVI